MGLYKDPDGKNITFKTTTLGDNLSVNDNATVKSSEMTALKKRVIYLETCLKQYVSKPACLFLAIEAHYTSVFVVHFLIIVIQQWNTPAHSRLFLLLLDTLYVTLNL